MGYYSHITFNDGAMINALELLRDVAQGRESLAFIDAERRSGYSYHTTAPADLIERDYPAWRAKFAPAAASPSALVKP